MGHLHNIKTHEGEVNIYSSVLLESEIYDITLGSSGYHWLVEVPVACMGYHIIIWVLEFLWFG